MQCEGVMLKDANNNDHQAAGGEDQSRHIDTSVPNPNPIALEEMPLYAVAAVPVA